MRGSPVAHFLELSRWLEAVYNGEWIWGRNSKCKYVTIKIDTRTGAYQILDRDDNPISFKQLEYQYRSNAET